MRAWNALSETELEDLLVEVAKEIDNRLRSDPVPPGVARASELPPTGETPAAKPETTLGGKEISASAPSPQRTGVEASSPAAEAEFGQHSAERLLGGVEDLRIVGEIGDLFVLREKWSAALYTYNRMIELAAPHKELSMAWGYEKLGQVHRKQNQRKSASECLRLAQILYRRTGRMEKMDEMERLLQKFGEPEPPPAIIPPK
jgi:hypothetical protein